MSRTSRAIAAGASGRRQASLLALSGLLAACSDRPSPSSPELAPARKPATPASIFIPGIVPKQIAFGANTDDSGLQVFRVNPNGTGLVQVSDWPGSSMPSWSPDRTKIVFSRDVGGNRMVRVMNIDGTGLTQLAEGHYPRWSPDGAKIAFQRHVNGGPPQVFTMNADGTGVEQLTNHPYGALLPSWSPDSKKITYAAASDGGSGGELEVWVMNDNGTNPHQVTDCTPGGMKCSAPDWHPGAGDNRLVYSASPFGASISQIRTIRANGTNDTLVRSVPGFTPTKFPVWSPDGTWIAYFDKSPHAAEPDISIMRGDGTGVQRVTFMPTQAKSGIDW